jgi:signal transduction histidine kinase
LETRISQVPLPSGNASARSAVVGEMDLRLVNRGLAYRTVFGLVLFAGFLISYLIPIGFPENDAPVLAAALIVTVVNGPLYLLLRRSPQRLSLYRYVTLVVDLLVITVIIYFLGGVDAIYAYPFYTLVILYTAVIFERPWHFVVAGVSSAILIGLFLAQDSGALPVENNLMGLHLNTIQEIVVVTACVIFFFFTASLGGMLSESLMARSRELAGANALVEATNRDLESKIAERTQKIEAQNLILQRQNESITQANRLKTEYLMTINHELKTPLTSLLGYGRMLLSYDVEPEKRREFTENILSQANTIKQFIDSLNQIEEIEAGITPIERSEVKLTDLLEETLVTLRPRFEQRDLKVTRSLDPESIPCVSADPEKIRQVLRNYLENAARITPRGGRIEIGIERKNDELRVGVHDTGPGIHAEYLDLVFERFQQLGSADDRHRGGLGLGLALVRSIVEMHGGRAWAVSPGHLEREAPEGNRGASFYFTLPLTDPESASRESVTA